MSYFPANPSSQTTLAIASVHTIDNSLLVLLLVLLLLLLLLLSFH